VAHGKVGGEGGGGGDGLDHGKLTLEGVSLAH